ncbi:MAG TPA: divergent PAP2 family protein [Lachnospiraceae bacterium]|nr:divergent PAP2 family protein [Lachnospiraceae bacterium]
MNFFKELGRNEIFLIAGCAWLIAQVLKTLIHLFFTRKFVAERLVGSGGMPSSHSSTVCALASAVAFNYGASSVEFAISFVLAIIVMYDAIGVRRETGIQAKILNEMLDIFTTMGKGLSVEEKLKEFIGHSPIQVLMGAMLGVLIATIMHPFF